MTLCADIPQIEQSLQLFVAPGRIGEIRIIGGGSPRGVYFTYDEIAEAAQMAATSFPAANGIYVELNPISAALMSRPRLVVCHELTKDEDITSRDKLLVDFDPARPADTSATDAEKELARLVMEECFEWLRNRGFPDPIFADSGNGFHLVYRIDLLPESDLVERFLKALDKQFSTDAVGVDTSVHNPSRITKLYGTPARKGPDTAERPHRLSKILSVPDCADGIVSAEQLQMVIDEINTPKPETPDNSETNGEGFKLPATAGDGSRHEMLKKLGGYMRVIGADESEILGTLQVFNQTRCSNGGKPDSELESIARYMAAKDVNQPMQALFEGWAGEDAEKAQRQQRLRLLLENSRKNLGNGHDLGSVLNRLTLGLAEITPTEPQKFKVITARELATTDYPLEYMIPGLLVKGQPAAIGGAKKSLKTTILIALVLALASGCKFLNEFYVTRRYRCGFFSGESGAATIKETAERIARSMPWINLEDYDLLFSFELPKLGQPNTAADLIRFINDNGLEFLGIDPLYLAMSAGDGASNLYTMGDKLSPLAEVIAETGCTIGLAHHARKVMKSDFTRFQPPELDDLAFAGIAEFVRQWLLLNRREEYDPENGGHHELWLAAGGSAGHSGLWALSIDEGTRQNEGGRFWQVSVSKASEARKEQADQRDKLKTERESVRQTRDREKVLAAYKMFPNGETPTKIRNTASLSGTKFEPINAELLKAGEIMPCNVQKNGRCIEGFRLKQQTSGTNGTDRDSSGTDSSCPGEQTGAGLNPLFRGICPGPDAPADSSNPSDQDNPAFCPDAVTPTGKRKPSRKKPKARKSPA